MPSLPHLSGASVVKVLERLGFAVPRRRGSHIVMRGRGVSCVVPDHRELKVGTLAAVLRQANVPVEAFLQAMKS